MCHDGHSLFNCELVFFVFALAYVDCGIAMDRGRQENGKSKIPLLSKISLRLDIRTSQQHQQQQLLPTESLISAQSSIKLKKFEEFFH